MPVLYKAIQSKLKTEDGLQLFHPRVVYTGNVSTAQLAEEVAAYSSLTPGDVKNTVDNLIQVLTQHLQASETVTLDGLGTFRFTLHSRGKGAASAEEVSASQSAGTVHFTPASTRNVDRTVATRSLVTGVKFTRLEDIASTATDSSSSGSGSSSGGSDNEEVNPLG